LGANSVCAAAPTAATKATAAASGSTRQQSFDTFTDELAAEWMRANPAAATAQAIDYGIPVSEVERYVVMPGQACAYKIGELEILAQRARAQKALGSKFSMKKFHDLLLRTETVPLAMLKRVVDTDIAATLHPAGSGT